MSRVCLGLFALAGVLNSTASADSMLYAVGGFAPSGFQSLHSVDALTGSATLIGTTGLEQISGLEWDGADLLAFTSAGDLYSLNRFNGSASLVHDATGVFPEGDLAFDGSGALWTTKGATIGTLTPDYAATAPLGAPVDLSGLSFGLDGTLYAAASNAWTGDVLYRVTFGSTMLELIGTTGTSSTVGALDVDPTTGSLFWTDGASLFTLDTGTGAGTLVGAMGSAGFSGMAFIPAPASLFALAGLSVLARRRA